MRRLILLRHGHAEPEGASDRDPERALTAQGRAAARAAGEALAAAGLRPDVALVSPARRARETWDAVAAVLGGPEATAAPELYDASADTLLAAARARPEAVVAVVAHNPGLQLLARRLAGAPTAFPPAALLAVAFEEAEAHDPDAVRVVLSRAGSETPA